MAPRWDSFEVPPETLQGREGFVREATKHSPARILDIGCGTGVLVPYLHKLCSGAFIVELDFSAEMLAINRSTHGAKIGEYCCDTIETAPFENESFDSVLCFNALPHFDVPKALLKSSALLKPKGRIAIGHLMSSADLNAFHASVEGPVAHDYLPLAKDLAQMLSDVGLAVLQCEERPGWYFVLAEK